MKSVNVKATVIKSVSAVLCTLLIAYACVTNTRKICDNNIAIKNAAASNDISSSDVSDDNPVTDSSDRSAEDFSSADSTEDTTAMSESAEEESASVSDNQTASEASSEKESAVKKVAKKKITLAGGLTSTDKEEVLEYYRLVSNKNSKVLFTKTLELVSLNSGENISQRMVDIFVPVAQKALSKNTVTDEPYPGKPDKIKASDWLEAKAENDGTYTTVYIKVVPQTDSYNGSKFEGSAGRTMTVLDGIDQALQEMSVISVDFSKTKMSVKYAEPTVKLKVKNSTGELVKGGCEWKYITDVSIETMEGKFLAFRIHLKNAGGIINYSVTY